jgi:hypothetical protein
MKNVTTSPDYLLNNQGLLFVEEAMFYFPMQKI